MGSGFLAKYVNALQLLGFLGYALASPAHRGRILSRNGALLLGVALFCTIPVFWWNHAHGWVTAEHLRHRGALDTGFHFHPASS